TRLCWASDPRGADRLDGCLSGALRRNREQRRRRPYRYDRLHPKRLPGGSPMSTFLVNLILALLWTAVTGSFSLANLVFGFLLAAFAIYLVREQTGAKSYINRLVLITRLILLFIKELVKSAYKVALTVLSPTMELKPGFIAYE